VSTAHIVTTSSLRFPLTLFVCTCAEEAELSFDFEAEDIYAAGGKVLEISRRMSECPGVLYWKILSVVQIRTGGPQWPPPFRYDAGQGLPGGYASPCEGSPFSSWRDSERKITHVTSAWQPRT
jgi:hypothetical protein